MMKKKYILMVLLITMIVGLSAQEISEKKDVAIFALNYYDTAIPSGALGVVDSQIQNVFINLGRFNIMGMTYRLGAHDINAFIEEIRKYNETNIEIPDEVKLGQVTFTEADFNRLTGAFITVVPIVTNYYAELRDDGTWEAVINTSFSFINVQTFETFAFINLETSGSGESENEAMRGAADSIAMQLEYEVRSISEFTLKTGIVDVLRGGKILLQFGEDMGLRLGDEFALIRTTTLSTGHQFPKEVGLVKITEITPELSYGYVLYAEGKAAIGEQLKEIPRLGTDASLYANMISTTATTATLIGFRTAISRGFYRFRPVVGFEVPLTSSTGALWGLPFNSYIGGEMNLYLGRIALRPMAALGIGGIIPITQLFDNPDSEEFIMTHIGGMVEVQGSYLMGRDWRLNGSAGLAYWVGLVDDGSLGSYLLGESYGGLYFGISATYKL